MVYFRESIISLYSCYSQSLSHLHLCNICLTFIWLSSGHTVLTARLTRPDLARKLDLSWFQLLDFCLNLQYVFYYSKSLTHVLYSRNFVLGSWVSGGIFDS